MIRAEGLAGRAGSFELRDVGFRVEEGRALVVLGPSGAGKTLLLETLLGLAAPTAGIVELDGKDITRLPPEERGVSYMPQDVGLFPHLSVRDNILFGRRVRKSLEGAEADLKQIAARLRIEPLLDRKTIASLSGGERQRVGLARALIVHPRVLFLDESFSALDAHIRAELQTQTRELQRSLGITAIYVTHHHDECFALGDDALVLMNGRVVQHATPESLFAHPATLAIATFLRKRNVLAVDRAKKVGELVELHVGELVLHGLEPTREAKHVHIEPDAIEVGEGVAENAIHGEIEAMHEATRSILVRVAPNTLIECAWLVRDRARIALAVGTRVVVRFPACAVTPLSSGAKQP